MPVRKFKTQYYYADYYDVAGVRRRVSLQTKNMLVARMKYDEIIQRRDAVKEKIHVHRRTGSADLRFHGRYQLHLRILSRSD